MVKVIVESTVYDVRSSDLLGQVSFKLQVKVRCVLWPNLKVIATS